MIKSFKKIILVLIVSFFICTLTACNNDTDKENIIDDNNRNWYEIFVYKWGYNVILIKRVLILNERYSC